MGRILVAIALLVLDLWGAPKVLSQLQGTVERPAHVDVVVRSSVPLTPADRQRLRAKIRKSGRDDAEEIVRELYQDKGFFKAEVLTVQTPNSKKNVLVLQVRPGKPYHLVRISWRGNRVFPESELVNLIPFKPGELFNRTKIAGGLEAVQKLYYSRGFINYASVPQPEIDDKAATIGFAIEVDEGRQFRFGELHVEGMEEAHREMLLSAWQGLRGRPYAVEDADNFFERYFRSPMPNIQPENYTVRKIDEANHLVNYSLKFSPYLRYRVNGSRLQPVEIP